MAANLPAPQYWPVSASEMLIVYFHCGNKSFSVFVKPFQAKFLLLLVSEQSFHRGALVLEAVSHCGCLTSCHAVSHRRDLRGGSHCSRPHSSGSVQIYFLCCSLLCCQVPISIFAEIFTREVCPWSSRKVL